MTNEFVKITLTNSDGFPRSYTASASMSWAKGTLLALTDENTCQPASAAQEVLAGVSAEEKKYGVTRVTAWTDGIFDAYASGAIPVGQPFQAAANSSNAIMQAALAASGAAIGGWVLGTAADKETISVRLRL